MLGLSLGRRYSSDIAKSTRSRIAARCGATGETPPLYHHVQDQVLPKQSKKQKLASTRGANQKHDYPTLKNQPESFINEAISLI